MTAAAVQRRHHGPIFVGALLAAALALPETAAALEPGELAAEVREFRQQREQRIVDDFAELLRLPNVASDLGAMERNANHIRSLLEARGIDTRLLRAEGAPPAIYGERAAPGAEFTVTVYVHYDGQPVQPENWASPPWQPTLRDGRVEDGGRELPLEAPFDPQWRLFARSAGDDKAPIIALVHALDALDSLGVAPSVHLKLFLDGEEERGSPHLGRVLSDHAALLKSDLWLFCDGPMHPSGRLQLAHGVRGHLGFNLTVYGSLRPLHSGHYGNWAPNPAAMVSHLVASMRDDDGRILIDGFHDEVDEITASERAAIAAMPSMDLALRQDLGLARTETDERIELAILRPALNVRGLSAGGVGENSRNIILPEATASIGLRLVPSQTLEGVRTAVERHLRNQGYHLVAEPPDHETRLAHPRIARVQWGNGYPAYRTPLDHPWALALAELLDEYAGGELIRSPTMGGSLPLYLIPKHVGAPVIILPVANHDNNQHGRDENLRLKNLWDAIEIYAVTLAGLGQRVAGVD